MVKITRNKGGSFGIDGYNLPIHQPASKGIEWKVGKNERKNFAEEIAKITSKYPAPSAYKTNLIWGCNEKKFKPGDKDSFIAQIFKQEKKFGFPSAVTYKPDIAATRPNVHQAKCPKEEGSGFLGDIEFRSATILASPQSKNVNPDTRHTKPKTVTMVCYAKEKASPKDQKLKKNDTPGPGTHKEIDLGYKITKPACLALKFKKDKRKGYAERSADARKWVPSPDSYKVEQMKSNLLHKRITSRRH